MFVCTQPTLLLLPPSPTPHLVMSVQPSFSIFFLFRISVLQPPPRLKSKSCCSLSSGLGRPAVNWLHNGKLLLCAFFLSFFFQIRFCSPTPDCICLLTIHFHLLLLHPPPPLAPTPPPYIESGEMGWEQGEQQENSGWDSAVRSVVARAERMACCVRRQQYCVSVSSRSSDVMNWSGGGGAERKKWEQQTPDS